MANISAIKVGNTSYGITATPTAHASTATTYGAASASNYGHVKLSDNYTSSAGAAASGIGASSAAVYNAYNTLNSNLETKSEWNWLGDFYGTNGFSVVDVKDKAREFLIRAVFAGSTGGAKVVIENHIINSERGAEPVAINSYFYSTSYYACIAHQYDYNNATINLYPSWTTLVGTQHEATSILSMVWYR